MKLHFSTAFTLLELLVVVAIIAILAAIAVPNFLEAQTRAKVSRAKSDMRTVTTGLESYRLDNNRYPPDFQDGVLPFIERLRFVTSPIAYLGSLPGDPFATEGAITGFVQAQPINPYAQNGVPGADYVYPLTYDYAKRINGDGSVEGPAIWGRITSTPLSTLWAMRSIGPDLDPAFLGSDPTPYDASNGTVSRGNIFWTGPGRGEDIPRDLL